MYYKRSGKIEWCPTCRNEKEGKPTINPGSRNEEKKFDGTVESAKRLWEWFQKGILSLEDFNYGISRNAEHIGITTGNLLEHVGISID